MPETFWHSGHHSYPAFIGQPGLEEHEAHYSYCKYGPLMREVIGQQQVQGFDFAYTLQGWVKGVNNTTLPGSGDIGNNSVVTPRDAYSYCLNYFNGDYLAINGLQPFADHTAKLGSACKQLYNGNINSLALNLRQFSQLWNEYGGSRSPKIRTAFPTGA